MLSVLETWINDKCMVCSNVGMVYMKQNKKQLVTAVKIVKAAKAKNTYNVKFADFIKTQIKVQTGYYITY